MRGVGRAGRGWVKHSEQINHAWVVWVVINYVLFGSKESIIKTKEIRDRKFLSVRVHEMTLI